MVAGEPIVMKINHFSHSFATDDNSLSQADRIYNHLKESLFNFELLPGDKFTETELATILGASRTPVRQALFKLEKEGYLQMRSRSGWTVCPIDFQKLKELYDLRILIELDALKKVAQLPNLKSILKPILDFWLAPPWQRSQDKVVIFQADESFHYQLVQHAGNKVISDLHWDITEKIRIVRQLDFTKPERCFITYDEHAQILNSLISGEIVKAQQLLEFHILKSRSSVEEISLTKLELARAWRKHHHDIAHTFISPH